MEFLNFRFDSTSPDSGDDDCAYWNWWMSLASKRYLWLYLECIHVIYGVCNRTEWFIAINNKNICESSKLRDENISHMIIFYSFSLTSALYTCFFSHCLNRQYFFFIISCIYSFHVRIDQQRITEKHSGCSLHDQD